MALSLLLRMSWFEDLAPMSKARLLIRMDFPAPGFSAENIEAFIELNMNAVDNGELRNFQFREH